MLDNKYPTLSRSPDVPISSMRGRGRAKEENMRYVDFQCMLFRFCRRVPLEYITKGCDLNQVCTSNFSNIFQMKCSKFAIFALANCPQSFSPLQTNLFPKVEFQRDENEVGLDPIDHHQLN